MQPRDSIKALYRERYWKHPLSKLDFDLIQDYKALTTSNIRDFYDSYIDGTFEDYLPAFYHFRYHLHFVYVIKKRKRYEVLLSLPFARAYLSYKSFVRVEHHRFAACVMSSSSLTRCVDLFHSLVHLILEKGFVFHGLSKSSNNA